MKRLEDLANEIKELVNKSGYIYIPIENKSIKKIHDLLFNYIFIEPENNNEWLYFGWFFGINQDYEQMKKYYLIGIEKGDNNAMCCLGDYYNDIKDYEQMKKYYLMAIERGNLCAMYNLGIYYENIKKDWEQAKKYYLMFGTGTGNNTTIEQFSSVEKVYNKLNDQVSLIKLYNKYNITDKLLTTL
jgi:tetratricopeptide (TPR) repeat protein